MDPVVPTLEAPTDGMRTADARATPSTLAHLVELLPGEVDHLTDFLRVVTGPEETRPRARGHPAHPATVAVIVTGRVGHFTESEHDHGTTPREQHRRMEIFRAEPTGIQPTPGTATAGPCSPSEPR